MTAFEDHALPLDLLNLDTGWHVNSCFLEQQKCHGPTPTNLGYGGIFEWDSNLFPSPQPVSEWLAEYNLYFEDWLEALVRISILKALPFDHEIEEAARSHPEVTHAGIYFQNLVLEDEASYNALLLERATPWGGEPSQPIARCVEHLLAIIIFKMEDDTAGKDNLVITEAEVERWCDMHNLW